MHRRAAPFVVGFVARSVLLCLLVIAPAASADAKRRDRKPPTVMLTAPTAGSTVSGSITMSANARDDIAVANVTFLVDGSVVGSDTTPDSTLPSLYSVSYDTTKVSDGSHTFSARSTDRSGQSSGDSSVTATVQNVVTPPPQPGTDPVATVAGDIADGGSGDTGTAQVVQNVNPDLVFTTGDNAYPDGTLSDYTTWFQPTWGAFKTKIRPAPGNHDYHTSGAAGYFDYFNGVGVQTGPAGTRGQGYYSYDVGLWHLIALNNYVSMSAGSAQEQWLRNDLAKTLQPCVLAYWHEPRFTSGAEHSNNTATAPLWDALYQAHADLVLNGHNHQYERFARQNSSGTADAMGIREIVVGTGGAGLYSFSTTQPNSEVRNATTHGVLKLTLHPASYDWDFRPSDGTFTDSGSTACH
jgi:hypothetical protein